MEPPIDRWQEFTTILVGPEQRKFIVHTSKLREIPFFRACLDVPMRESLEGVVKMPEDDPAAFSEVVDWIYHKKFEVDLPKICAENRDIERPHRPDVSLLRITRIRTYLLAQKLMAESLLNTVIDDLRAAWGISLPGNNELRLIFEAADQDNKLHELARRHLAYVICHKGGWNPWKASSPFTYVGLLQGNAELLEVALSAVSSFPNKTYTVCSLPKCHFHVHMDTAECAE